MLPLRPRQIVGELVLGPLEVAAARDSLAQAPEENPLLIGVSKKRIAFPEIAITKVVYQVRREYAGIIHHKALVVVQERRLRKIAWSRSVRVWQERLLRIALIGHRSRP